MAWEGEVLFECLRIGQYGNNEKSNYARKLWTLMNLTCELTFNLTSNSNNNKRQKMAIILLILVAVIRDWEIYHI